MNSYPLLPYIVIAVHVKNTMEKYPPLRGIATDFIKRDGRCFGCSMCPFSGSGTHFVCVITGIFTPERIEIDRNTPWKRQLRLSILSSLGIRP